MTELEILKNSVFDEIARIKRGTANLEDSAMIMKAANVICAICNVQLKAADLIIESQNLGAELPEISIFKEDETKNMIDYKAKDEAMY